MDPILHELQEAVEGLTFRSESDYPFEIVDLGRAAHLDPTPAQLLDMLGRLPGATTEVVELEYFFRNVTGERPGQSERAQQEAARFRALEKLLKEKLANVKVIRVGTVQVEVFLLGSTPSGRLVGLKTTLIET